MPSDKLDTEPDMEEQQSQQPNPMEVIMRQMQQMQLKQDLLEKELNKAQQKEESKAFTKTWEETATLETQDPLARKVANLEKPKKVDKSLNYLEILQADVDSGRADRNTHAELRKAEKAYIKKMR